MSTNVVNAALYLLSGEGGFEGSVAIDQAHDRAIVTAPAVSGLTPGTRFGVVRVITSQATCSPD
jgi:hypothetical protein